MSTNALQASGAASSAPLVETVPEQVPRVSGVGPSANPPSGGAGTGGGTPPSPVGAEGSSDNGAALPMDLGGTGETAGTDVELPTTNTPLPAAELEALAGPIMSPFTPNDGLVRTMFRLRVKLMANGAPAQLQVCEHPLFHRVCSMVTAAPGEFHPKVVEGACRIVCTLAAKNVRTPTIIAATPGVVEALFGLIVSGAQHAPHSGSCHECVASAVTAESPDPGVFSLNSCPVSAPACGAMWAVCAMCMRTPSFQSLFVGNSAALAAVTAHLPSTCEEAVSSASWLLCNAVLNSPALSPTLMAAGVARPLLDVLSKGPKAAKGLASWAVRSVLVGNKTIQEAFADMGAIPVLTDVLNTDMPATQAGAAWALGTLCTGVPSIQHALRTTEDGRAIRTMVSLLDSSFVQVQNQVAATLYNIAAHCTENQTFVVACGGAEKLVAMLPKTQGSVKTVEKAIAGLLCLALKHAENQKYIAALPGFPFQIVRFLGCSAPRIQGLSAGMIRTLVADLPDIQALFIAHGALAYLLDLCATKDPFAQEQSVAAMVNLLQVPASRHYMHLLNPEGPLVALVTDCTKPTRMAYTCALIVLFTLADDNEVCRARLATVDPLIQALLRFCHSACGDPRLRAQAERLLKFLAPEAFASRPTLCPLAVLDAMVTFTAQPHGSTRFECAVCMGDASGAPDSEMVFLPCCHPFHVACIKPWFSSGHDVCPTCKFPVMATIHEMVGAGGGDLTKLIPAAAEPAQAGPHATL